MSIEIKVTKEIGNYEPKLIGPFTARQSIVFGLAAVMAIFLYKNVSAYFSKSIAGYACMVPASLALLFTWKPYGMHFEKFLKSIFVNMFLAPTHRRYRTENSMEGTLKKLNSAQAALKAAEEAAPSHSHFGIPRKQPRPNKTSAEPPSPPPLSVTAAKKKAQQGKKSSLSLFPTKKDKDKVYKMSSKAIR